MKPNFKDYNQQQNWLFPPSIEEMIPREHPVRIVNGVIEQLDLKLLTEVYAREGRPSYHPKMLLKVMVYAYMDNIYSSRKIEKAMKENVNFMWLSGMQVADHNTLARFRSNKLKDVFKEIFKQVVLLLAQEGLVKLKEVYTDGTKIESVAGRYTFVWGNAIKTTKEKMAAQLEQLWNYAQAVAAQDGRDDQDEPTPPSFKEITPEKVEQTVKAIERKIKDHPEFNKKAKAKLRYIKTNFILNLKKYRQQQTILGQRSSYSKTDPDATFMRMKEDHMKNGQLKPAYNVQISTENQIILHYTIHQKTNDLNTLKPHLESFEQLYHLLPKVHTADAGYGSEENYEYLEQKGIETYVKYNTFDKEQDRKKNDPSLGFQREDLFYNKEQDFYVCPMGQRMEKIGEFTSTTRSGYRQKSSVYQAKNCEGCPLRASCFKGKGNRRVQRNHHLEQYKTKVRENLLSEIGEYYRKKRSVEVEPVFGHIKYNRHFTRFTHRGLKKVELEFGLHALANNLKKITA